MNVVDKNENKIIAIDISSNSVKIGLVSEHLKLELIESQNINIINEDLEVIATPSNGRVCSLFRG
jgi:sugar (pentulose or hexulose) kinase